MTPQTLKTKVRQEVIEYGLNVAYLAIVFAAFTEYRRLLLAAHNISYANYGVALIEALILGKVIMIGSVLRLARGLDARPLIYPTLYKTSVFCVFVAAFKLIEHGIKGLFTGDGLVQGVAGMLDKGLHEMLANSLVVFVALFPFFAVKELGRALGRQRIASLFFRSSTAP